MIIWNRKCKGPRCFDSREQGERGGEGVREYFILRRDLSSHRLEKVEWMFHG